MGMDRSNILKIVMLVLITVAFSFSANVRVYGQELPEWLLPSDYPVHTSYELDEAADNSAHLPAVGNRGSQNSATAWSVAYYYKTYQEWEERHWDVSTSSHRFSPAFVFNLTNHGINQDSDLADVMELLRFNGCATMVDMPYDAEDYTTWPTRPDWINAMEYRTGPWYYIDLDTTGVEQLKSLLLDGHIALVELNVYGNFTNIDEYGGNYCLSEIYGNPEGTIVLPVVGFMDNHVNDDGLGAFKVVNSVGTVWGLSGYCWVTYDAMTSLTTSSGFAFHADDLTDYEPSFLATMDISHTDKYGISLDVGLGTVEDRRWSRTFFSWMDAYAYARVAVPPVEIVLDLTDAAWMLDRYRLNPMFAGVRDNHPGNGHSGQINEAQIIYPAWNDTIPALNTPLEIPDLDTTVYAEFSLAGPAALPSPVDLTAELDEQYGYVFLDWEPPDIEGPTENLIYDDGWPSGYYDFQGYTLGQRMSPSDSCRLLRVSYYLRVTGSDQPFQVKVFNWNEITGMPGDSLLYSSTETVSSNGWHDFSIDQNLVFGSDFIVAFGSLNTTVRLGYDDDNNERCFDFNGSTWSAWPQTYFIRAQVRLDRGGSMIQQAGSDDELDDFLSYHVYRDSTLIASPVDHEYIDRIVQYGTYHYWVTAQYDNGESEPAGPLELIWNLDVDEDKLSLPQEFFISEAYPNPFNATSVVEVHLPEAGTVELELVNILGQVVQKHTLGVQNAGIHLVTVNAHELASGMYYLRATHDGKAAPLRRIVLLK